MPRDPVLHSRIRDMVAEAVESALLMRFTEARRVTDADFIVRIQNPDDSEEYGVRVSVRKA